MKRKQITQLAGVLCLFMLATQGCAHKHKADQPPPAPSGEDTSAASTPAAATDEAPPSAPAADAAPAAEPTATAIVETPPAPTAEETPPPPTADATPAEPVAAAEAPAEVPKPVVKRKHHRKAPKENFQPLSVAQAAAAAAAMTPPPDQNAQMNAMNQAPPTPPAPEPVQQKAPPPRKVVAEAPREPAEQKPAADEQPFYMKPQILGPAALVLAILTGMSIIRRRNNS